jgi:hypothetical protein
MGTRQRFTTSTSLGFRLCGMRVFRNEGLHCVDRFFGRTLTPSTIANAMEAFLFDGYTTRKELIPSILEALQRLLEVMEESVCRLYTSSLLFIYEGDETRREEDEYARVDVKIVDFAHGVSKESSEGELDDGFVFGLKNLIILFQSLLSHKNSSSSSSIGFIEKSSSSSSSSSSSRCAPFVEHSNKQKVVALE